ncbi:MAG TPA: Flp pilus assembly protein CpaB [Dehalococcoidia bacterium]|nr:Flp pilus assembly protein CpaB [Dehalococcoidia bacterium]
MARTLTNELTDRSSRTFLLLALVFAGITAALVYAGLRASGGDDEGGGAAQAATVPVVVAAQDIGIGQEITADMVEVKSLPTDIVVAGAFSKPEDVVGKNAAGLIEKGDQLSPTKVSQYYIPRLNEDVKAPSLVIPKGMRGFSVPVTEVTGVGGLLLPGDRVDVIAVFDENENFDRAKAVVLLQNIMVVSVAQEALEPAPAAGAAEGEQQEEGEAAQPAPNTEGVLPPDVENQPSARQVVLAVTPQDAALLALVQQNATLYVSLRRQGDDAPIPGPTEVDLLPLGYQPSPNR